MRQKQQSELSGYFWLPESLHHRVPGKLTIETNGKVSLETYGSLDEENELLGQAIQKKRICGHSSDGELVTLEDCLCRKCEISSNDLSVNKFHVHKLLSGACWEKDEEIYFNEINFSVDCLSEWVNKSGFKNDNANSNSNMPIEFSYELPDSMLFEINENLTLEICFSYRHSRIAFEASTTQNCYFKIKSKVEVPLKTLEEHVHRINKFMCFVTGTIVSVDFLRCFSNNLKREYGTDEKYPAPIHITHESTIFTETKPTKHFSNMLIAYKDIEGDAGNIFKKWFSLYEVLSPALDLYFYTKTNTSTVLETKFLSLAQGLETLHRRTNNETLMEKSAFKILFNQILEATPEQHKEWLRQRLSHGNELTLRDRIRMLISPFKEFIGDEDSQAKLIGFIVNTRNYLTHFNSSLEKRAKKGTELFELNQKMEAIFQLHILSLIGFTNDQIASLVERHQPLKNKLSKI